MLEQSTEGLHPVERTYVRALLEELIWEGPTLEQLVKACIPWEGSHSGTEEKCERGKSDRDKLFLTTTCIPYPPVLFGGPRTDADPGEKERGEGECL